MRRISIHPGRGFTLIELLIVVAIIAILAAIAVPNFLEAQVRAKVARARTDMRSIATGIEAYRVDHNSYPEGTDNPNNYPTEISTFLGPLAPGYYTFRTRSASGTVGVAFAGLTTPIAYMTAIPTDPFAGHAAGFLTYCYRNSKDRKNGWIITSAGPDADLLAPGGVGNPDTSNPLSTASDSNTPARLGDINERAVIHVFEGTGGAPLATMSRSEMTGYLEHLSYDPTNGTVSDGDIYRIP